MGKARDELEDKLSLAIALLHDARRVINGLDGQLLTEGGREQFEKDLDGLLAEIHEESEQAVNSKPRRVRSYHISCTAGEFPDTYIRQGHYIKLRKK
jgi:hypothetical protein